MKEWSRKTGCRAALIGACSAWLAGCSTSSSPSDSTMAAPWQGGTLVYATDREPLCLDPHVLGDMPQVFVASQYLDSLVSMDARGDIHPWLATDWSVSADGLSYTFHLRKDVHFTDGTPFNARALKANLDQITDPQTQSSTAGGYIRQYRGTDIVDDYTAVVHLDRPYAAFLEVLAQGFLGMESPRAMARGRDINCQSPVGSGPFKVVRWDRQSQVILSRNPDYQWAPPYAGHPGPAWLQRVVWKFIPEPSIRFASLEAGEVDVIEALPPEDEGTARRNPELSVVEADRPGNPTNGTFNLTRSPFNDRRVREAFVRAADVEGALHSVYFGQYHRAGGPLSPTTPFYRSDFEHAQDYDPLRAAKLLDQAGWTGHDADGYRTRDGHRLVVHALISNETAPAELTLWEQVQATTRAVGIDLRMDMLSASAALRRQGAWDYDIRVGYWNTNTADVLRIVFGSEFLGPTGGKGGFHQNSSGYHDPVLDGLLQQALVTRDASRRQGLYARAQQIVSAQYLQLTTYPQSTRLAVYHHAHGVRLEPSLQVSWLHDAWVSP